MEVTEGGRGGRCGPDCTARLDVGFEGRLTGRGNWGLRSSVVFIRASAGAKNIGI